MSDWLRLCAVDASLAEKRSAVEAYCLAKTMEGLHDAIEELGCPELSGAVLDDARALLLEALQPIIDEDFARLFGAAAMN